MMKRSSQNQMQPTTCSAFSACHFSANNTTAMNEFCDTALAVSFFVLSILVAILLRSILVLPIVISLLVLLKSNRRKVKQNG